MNICENKCYMECYLYRNLATNMKKFCFCCVSHGAKSSQSKLALTGVNRINMLTLQIKPSVYTAKPEVHDNCVFYTESIRSL